MPQTPQTNYGWKQPTPFSSLKENQNLTVFDRLVFYAIWENVRNSDGSYDFRHGNKLYQNIEVKRGEAIFAVDRFAKNIGNDPKHVRRSIEKLKKWYTEMEIERKPFGLLIRFNHYDGMVIMEIEKEINSKSIANQSQINSRASKKNVLKSVKNEKSEILGEQSSQNIKNNTEGSLRESLIKQLQDNKGKSDIYHKWQDKAFRYAEAMKIELSDNSLKARWLKVFRDADKDKDLSVMVEKAYVYVIDYYPFNTTNDSEHKIKYFLHGVYKGFQK